MTLSLCMIVKNEESVLDRALSNAGVFADEIVIVDTGSTDGTKRVASRYTDKVFDFEWRDDFAAARNFAISKSTGDYFIWLDADDIVPMPSARAISRLFRSLPRDTDIVMLPYVLGDSLSFYRERIIRRTPDNLFVGRVHEAVGLRGKVVKARPAIYHAKPQGRSSGTRNLDIYRKAESEGAVFSPREVYYFARELYYNGELEAAAVKFEGFLSMPDGFNVNKTDACLLLSRCYERSGDRARALSVLYDSFLFGLPTGEVCCEIALMYFTDKKYELAAYWFERAAHAKPDIRSGAFVDTDYYGFLPYVWLSVCYDKLGKRRKAYSYHCRARKLKPDHPSVVINQAYFEGLGF